MISDFRGFRGPAALCQIGDIEFLLLAKNAKQLEAIYTGLMPDAPPFNRADCKPSIIIQSNLLPKPKESTPT